MSWRTPGAYLSMGELARVGKALTLVGNSLLDAAKEQASANGEKVVEDDGVRFEIMPPSESERVDTQYVRATYGQDERVFTYSTRKGYVKVSGI